VRGEVCSRGDFLRGSLSGGRCAAGRRREG